MVNIIIEEINHALECNCLLSALALTLILPDVCGKAEWPEEKSNGIRYRDWFDKYVGISENCSCDECIKVQMPQITGEVVYSLRNCILHQGTADIDKMAKRKNYIDEFVLVTERKKEYGPYIDRRSVIEEFNEDGTKKETRKIYVNMRRLCFVLASCAKGYYEKNKEKFNFVHFSVMDWDKELEKISDFL